MSWFDDVIAPRIQSNGVESTPKRGTWDFGNASVTDDPANNKKLIQVSVPPDTNVSETFALSGVLTPPQLTATTNNWNPSGIADATVVRASSNARQFLTGIAGGTVGRVLILVNVGSNTIALSPDNASSLAANRLYPPRAAGNTEWDLFPGESVVLHYPVASAGWVVLGQRSEVFGRFTIGFGSLSQDEPLIGRFGASTIKCGHSSGTVRRIGGFDGEGTERDRFTFIHTGSTPLIFQNEDTTQATVGRRLRLPMDQLFLFPNEQLQFQYDATSAGRWIPLFCNGVGFKRGSNLTDGDVTITYAGGVDYQLPFGTLTTARNLALGNSGAPAYAFVATVRRFDRSANAYNVRNLTTGGTILFTFPASTPGEADFRWDGTTNYAFAGFKPYP